MTGKPLTPEEVDELDTYGELRGNVAAPARAIELWQRELLFGREHPDPRTAALRRLASSDKECCFTCRFHKIRGSRCRRFPPVVYYDVSTLQLVTRFPQTNQDMWCGEYERGEPA